MTASVASNPEGSTGFRMEQLAAALDRVMNSPGWNALIPARGEGGRRRGDWTGWNRR